MVPNMTSICYYGKTKTGFKDMFYNRINTCLLLPNFLLHSFFKNKCCIAYPLA